MEGIGGGPRCHWPRRKARQLCRAAAWVEADPLDGGDHVEVSSIVELTETARPDEIYGRDIRVI